MRKNKVIILEEREVYPLEALQKTLFSLGFFDFSFVLCQNFEQCKEECKQDFAKAIVICDNAKLDNLLENVKEDGDALSLLFEQAVTLARGENRMLFLPAQVPYEKFLKDFLGEADVQTYSVFGKTASQLKSIFNSIRCDYKIITKSPLIHTIYCFTKVNEELVKSAIGDNLFSMKDEALSVVCARVLREKGASISIAEHSTAGLVCGNLLGRVQNAHILASQEDFLAFGVGEQLLKENGIASKEVAFELTKNLLKKEQTELAVSVLGDKGRFFVSIGNQQQIYVYSTSFEGDRKQALENVVDFTLFRLLKVLK